MDKIENTEEKILEAAKQVFQIKGLAGARMQEIADVAGINKALLHYYFRTKEKLFTVIFRFALKELQPQVIGILNSDLSLEDKIRAFVEKYLNIIKKNPSLPQFVINQLNQNPDSFDKIFEKGIIFDFTNFESDVFLFCTVMNFPLIK